jgi:MFS family permease
MAACLVRSPVLPHPDSRTPEAPRASRRLPLVIVSNGILRVAGGASSVLVGLYVADLAHRGFDVGVALAGTLAAMSFGAELVSAVPLGILADVLPARLLMTVGALVAALAAVLFGATHHVEVFVVSRALEGLAAGASVPALLAYVTDVTAGDKALRARVMSYFELSLLAGLALGGVVGTQLWSALGRWAFAALAVIYVVAAIMLFIGSVPGRRHHGRDAITGLMRALGQPALRRLAPVWLCINAIVGLWLGPPLYFLLTHRADNRQLLPGLFADQPTQLGWLLLAYALVFGSGLAAWSIVLPRVTLRAALRTSLVAMLGVSAGLLLLNHAGAAPVGLRWGLTAVIAGLIMVESGFTPAALALLAAAVGPGTGRGAAMGIYSFLLSVGALGGSLLAGLVGQRLAIDGLIYATLALAVIALLLLSRLDPVRVATSETA